MDYPAWLPEKVDLNGNWTEKLKFLYEIFQKDFVLNRPHFKGLPIAWDARKLDGDSFEEGFWHLITQTERSTKERYPDFRRAERLKWCLALIKNYQDPSILHFLYEHSGGKRKVVRTYLWLKEHDYLVILEERPSSAFLHTAYHLDGPSGKGAIKRKYEERIKDRRHY